MSNEPPIAPKSPSFDSAVSGARTFADTSENYVCIGALVDGAIAGTSVMNLIKAIIYWGARGFILPYELLFRERIGARYVSAPVILAYLLVAATLHLSGQVSPFIELLIGTAVGFGYVRQFLTRRKSRESWHSYSEGESLLEIKSLQNRWDETFYLSGFYVSKTFIEPLVPLALAAICSTWWVPTHGFNPSVIISNPLTIYFVLSAIVMLGYQCLCATIRRHQYLDFVDAALMIAARNQASKPTLSRESRFRRHNGVAYVTNRGRIKWD